MMIAEHRHLVEQGAQLVELRLDYIVRAVNLKRLLNDRPSPVIVACRRDRDGGKWPGTEEARLMLLRSAIAEGVDYVDLEEDIAGDIPRFGKTKRIISYHNFRETPDNLEEIHERMTKLDPDIVKLATMAHHPDDNLRMFRLMKDSRVPTIGICMGEIGVPTRILAGKFGAPFTYATFHHERALAPGQLSYEQMTQIYQYGRIRPDTEVYGVIADPVGHSFSPIVHNAAFQHLNLNKVYVPFRIPREYLRSFLSDCPELDVHGLSVTIPHKEEVIRFLSKIDGASNRIGAVNTVVFEDKEGVGYNTDYRAALDSLISVYAETGGETALQGKKALLLGAGGVAKAIALGLKRRNVDVIITSRNIDRAQALAKRVEARAVDWSTRHRIQPNILINATPVGMHPNVDESPYEKHFLHRATVVFDTVYNPEQTLLIKDARERNCRVVTGVEMFIRQAALQFKLFTGQDPPEQIILERLRGAIGAARRV